MSKQRFWFLDIEIVHAGHEFHSRTTKTTSNDKEFDAEAYVSEFFGEADEGSKVSDGSKGNSYSFDCQAGTIVCRVYRLKEMDYKEYQVVSRFI